MRLLFLSVMCFITIGSSFGQAPKDSVALARRDSLRMAKMIENSIYPLIKGAPMGGVIPILNADELPDPKLKYKLLMNFTVAANTPAKAKKINGAMEEVARIVNLHMAAGVPKSHLDVAVIIHGLALFSLLDDEHYQKKFKIDNPNSKLLKELQDAGIRFMVCGQAMKFLEIEKENLLPGIKLAYSAKTVITAYSLKGFVLTDVND